MPNIDTLRVAICKHTGKKVVQTLVSYKDGKEDWLCLHNDSAHYDKKEVERYERHKKSLVKAIMKYYGQITKILKYVEISPNKYLDEKTLKSEVLCHFTDKVRVDRGLTGDQKDAVIAYLTDKLKEVK